MLCYDPGLTIARAGLAMGVAEGFVPTLTPRILSGDRPGANQPPRHESDFVDRVVAQERELCRPPSPVHRLNEQQRVRHEALRALEATGRTGYPVAVPRDTSVAAARAAFASPSARTENGPESGPQSGTGCSSTPAVGDVVSVVGRVRAVRDLGGVSFAVIEEGGARIQALVRADGTPADERAAWRRFVHLGDQVSVTGPLLRSRSGEPSVAVQSWVMAATCLNPLPTLHATLAESARTRQRTLDLLTHPEAVYLLRGRGLAVRALRDAFVAEGYLEVETPMLQSVHGGASARPFTTHINAYDMGLYLRIAPELFLKRLMVAGMDRIFEVGRNFRNEGADATHNPEFTSVEAYAAHADYVEMRKLTRRVILAMARAVHGREIALRPDGQGGYTEVDLSGEWPVRTLHEAVAEATGAPLTPETPAAEVAALCARHDVAVPLDASAGLMVKELYEALVEKQTVMPTFYCDFPVEVSPLARPHRRVPGLTEQWGPHGRPGDRRRPGRHDVHGPEHPRHPRLPVRQAAMSLPMSPSVIPSMSPR
nr:amino acid--tRNA ligase-related protein [Agilicoccus flavus]